MSSNNKPNTNADTWFEVMVLEYLGDELDKTQAEKLDQLLQKDQKLRHKFVEICYQSTLFKESLENRVSEITPQISDPSESNWNILSDVIELEEEVTRLKTEKEELTLASSHASALELVQESSKAKIRDRQIVIPTAFFYAALLSIVAIIGLSTYFNGQRQIPDQIKKPLVVAQDYVARIESTKDCIWEKEYTHGQNLKPGVISLVKGKAKIIFGNDAEIELVGPTQIDLMTNSTCRLIQGSLDAFCPPGAEGFTVDIPGGKVIDRGTLFSVSVTTIGDKSHSDIAVEAGQVDLSSIDANGNTIETASLLVDQYAEIDSDSTKIAVYKMQPFKIYGTGYGLSYKNKIDKNWKVVGSSDKGHDFREGHAYYKRQSSLKKEIQDLVNKATAQWIGMDPIDTARKDNVTYTYQTAFYLDGFNLKKTIVSGRFLADDVVTGIRINGNAIEVPKQTHYIPHKDLQPFEIRSFFVEGRNTIEFDVKNEGQGGKGAPNPTGLLVFLKGQGAKLVQTKTHENIPAFKP